jgi:4-diphosphocytidyl-2-C-methyl-D-erythritol kinase
MKSLSLKACAKVNLGLSVIGKRGDGYHELRTIYQSISLADDLAVSISPGSSVVDLEVSGIPVPAGSANLAVRAAEALVEELNLKRRVQLRLHKIIPAGSGLGGASSDAAAVLRALLRLSGKSLPAGRLLRLAASLGSDVPFFLLGGAALGVGRGEEVYPLPESPRRPLVVVFPGVPVATPDAYARLRAPLLTSFRANHNIDLFCGKLYAGAWQEIGNDFECVVFPHLPQLARIKRSLVRSGARFASLSGSGSAVFGLFDDVATARRAASGLSRPGMDIFLARTVSRREFQAQLPSPSRR